MSRRAMALCSLLIAGVLSHGCVDPPPQPTVRVRIAGLRATRATMLTRADDVTIRLYFHRATAGDAGASMDAAVSSNGGWNPLSEVRRLASWDGNDPQEVLFQLPEETFDGVRGVATIDRLCGSGGAGVEILAEGVDGALQLRPTSSGPRATVEIVLRGRDPNLSCP